MDINVEKSGFNLLLLRTRFPRRSVVRYTQMHGVYRAWFEREIEARRASSPIKGLISHKWAAQPRLCMIDI